MQYQFLKQKSNGLSCTSQQWRLCRRVCDCQSNSYRPELPKFFGRGPHSLLHNNLKARHLAQCDFFGRCYILTKQHIFHEYIFSLLAKCVLQPGEMALQVGFVLRTVVWRTLIQTMKRRSGDSTHHCRSPTPTLNDCDLTPNTDTNFWAGI